MTATKKLLDYYHASNFADFPTVKVPLIDEQTTDKTRIVIVPRQPAHDPLFALARRDPFAARVFYARLTDEERRRRLFSDVEALERTAR